jgi:GxxExxY protein
MNADALVLNPLSKRVIGCALTVSNGLGSGFLEKVYENALAHELRKAAVAVEQQRGITVTYDGITVGEYFADLLVEGVVLVELKTVRVLRRRPPRAMPELSARHRPAPVPTNELWHAAPRGQAHCHEPVKPSFFFCACPRTCSGGSFAPLCVHLRYDLSFSRWQVSQCYTNIDKQPY